MRDTAVTKRSWGGAGGVVTEVILYTFVDAA